MARRGRQKREQCHTIARKMKRSKKKRKRAKKVDEEVGEPIKKRKKGEDKHKKVQTTIDQFAGKHRDKSYTPI